MSRLTVYREDDETTPVLDTREFDAIAAALAPLGVGFERWRATAVLGADADDAAVLAAYADDVKRLEARGGYRSVDVVRMTPDHPDATAARDKFLSEHTHDEAEVRFFVEGAGLFCLRGDGHIHQMLCEAGDLLSVPAGIRHWFDMSEHPRFTAIRLFETPDGWVGNFTGDTIAARFPPMAPHLA